MKKKIKKLIECRQKLSKELGLEEKSIELSMGMSNDFEQAVTCLLHLKRFNG
jgi:uncharacterized pyridoxal phosphate-containing UPF0001 family protein